MAEPIAARLKRRAAYTGRIEWAGNLLNEIKPSGKIVGVEVGFWKGDFGKMMLDLHPRLHWIAVDPYEEYGKKRRKQLTWDGIYNKVVAKMSVHDKRFKFIRERSEKGVKKVPKGVDFVWIDGSHTYDVVVKDLRLYEPKVRSGGVMSGHDYHSAGVKQAVDEYVKRHKRELHLEKDFDRCTVFWWRMP